MLVYALILYQCSADVGVFCRGKSCYEVLGLQKDTADSSAIKKAYYSMSQLFHPDSPSGGDDQKFLDVADAYRALKDEKTRIEYDEFLDHPERFYFSTDSWIKKSSVGRQESVLTVMLMIFVGLTFGDFMFKRASYNDLRRRLVHDPLVQERIRAVRGLPDVAVSKKGKKKRDYDPKLAESITDEEINKVVHHAEWFSTQAPTLATLLPVRMLSWPKSLLLLVIWVGHWLIVFTICRRQYGDEQKKFLIRYYLGLSQKQWDFIPEHRRQTYLEQKLWDFKTFQVWRRKQRNRSGESGGDDSFID